VFFSFVCDDLGVSLWVIMGVTIFLVIEFITFLVFILELIIGIKASTMENCPSSFKYFYFYPIVGIIIGIVVYCARFHFVSEKVGSNTNVVSSFFHFYFLSCFIYRETGKKIFLKYLIIVLSFILVLFIISNIKQIRSSHALAFGNVCLFTFCIYYFLLLLNKNPVSNLRNSPTFIICCGIFLGVGLTIPFAVIRKYLDILNFPRDTIYFYGALSGLGYLVMNLFFLKALLCLKQNK
jgi:hypothetical protein